MNRIIVLILTVLFVGCAVAPEQTTPSVGQVKQGLTSTLTKTISFATGPEGFVDAGATASDMTWEPNDSASGTGGSMKLTCPFKNLPVIYNWGTQEPSNGGTPQTWEDWGVPAGSTVTGIRLVSWSYKTVANTKLIEHKPAFSLGFVNTLSNVFIYSSATNLPLGISGWTAGPVSGNVATLNSASSDVFYLNLDWQIGTGAGNGKANVDVRLDEITYEVTYL